MLKTVVYETLPICYAFKLEMDQNFGFVFGPKSEFCPHLVFGENDDENSAGSGA